MVSAKDRINPMLDRLLRLGAFWKLLLFYGIPFIQVMTDRAGGPGTKIGGVVFGFYPIVTLYFLWLLAIQIRLERNVSAFILKSFDFKRIRHELIAIILFLLPYEIWWTNMLIQNSPELKPVLFAVSAVISFVFMILTIHCHIALSRMMVVLTTQSDRVTFSDYGRVFLYFLCGPFTIWLLQQQVDKASNSRWSDFGISK